MIAQQKLQFSLVLTLLISILNLQRSTSFAQGPLAPPGEPAPTMRTLEEIWNRIGVLESALNSQQQTIEVLQQQNSLLLDSTGVPMAWQITAVDSAGNVGQHTSLAFTPAGLPAISYYDVSNLDLKFAIFDGAVWQLATVDTNGSAGQFTSLAFAPGGQPAISYYDATGLNLNYAISDGTNWQLTAVDTNGSVGQYTSLAFLPSGQPAISYYDASTLDLKFAAFDGTNWQVASVDTNGSAGQYTSLAISPGGQPAIGYNGNGDLKYAVFNGATWQITTVDPGSPTYVSLAFGPTGPAISYYTPSLLRYAVFDGTAWTSSTAAGVVGPPDDDGRFSSLAFGPDAQPAISYQHDSGDPDERLLRFARFNGATWTLSTVKDAPVRSEYTSLAFGPDGQPAISYYDSGLGRDDLMFARRGIFPPAP